MSIMEFFDSHAHYNDEKFSLDREEILQEIYNDGITKLVNAGYSLESSKLAKKKKKKHEWIYTISGISPNDIPNNVNELKEQIYELERFIVNEKNTEKIVAIGEIGLDYYWNEDNVELQRKAFNEQIDLANKQQLPVVIHTREAVMDTIKILRENEVLKKGVFHCCPLNRELVKEALKLGFYISFAGPITFKNSKNANEIIEMVPLEKILIETDSPYLSPEPNRGKRNDSRNVKFIAQKIAEVKKTSLDDIAMTTYKNACQIFKLTK